MATPSTRTAPQGSFLPRLARDLVRNPVPCGVSQHTEPSAAVFVLEAGVPEYISDYPMYWLVCSDPRCEREARLQADSYIPRSTDFRPATVREIESISGLDVLGSLDAPQMFLPSQLSTPELVEAALAATSDPLVHANLEVRLDTMKRLAKPGYDPFAGVVQADYSFDEAF